MPPVLKFVIRRELSISGQPIEEQENGSLQPAKPTVTGRIQQVEAGCGPCATKDLDLETANRR